ncbi:hypothetical protein KP509_1Z123600 [Ceratopteris richardii]|nr:hypothetical protein KP509_1Z123600 [Ceratopteris richardii]
MAEKESEHVDISEDADPPSKEEFKVGDHVQWKYRTGLREGHIVEKLTHDSPGHRASEAHPKFVVYDEKRGKQYARNPDKLHKLPPD